MKFNTKLKVLSFVLIAYCAVFLCSVYGAIIDKLVLFPSTRNIDSTYSRIELRTESGSVLEVIEYIPKKPKTIVIAFHGNASRAEWEIKRQRRLWVESAHIIAVNFPGYGGSSGPATLSSFVDAADLSYERASKFAKEQNIPIIISGNSIGTLAAFELGSRVESGGILVRNPPPLKELILNEHGWWNFYLLAYPLSLGIPETSDSLKLAPEAKAPIVFLQSEADKEVPVYLQDNIRHRIKTPIKYYQIAKAGHNTRLSATQLEEVQPLLQWLLESSI